MHASGTCPGAAKISSSCRLRSRRQGAAEMVDARPAALGAAAVRLVTGAGGAAYPTAVLRTHPGHAAAAAVATGRALVLRTDVRQQTTVTGTLGYEGSYSVIAPSTAAAGAGTGSGSPGVITWLPAAGARVSRGEPGFAGDGAP